jgi:hypothetical protein
VCSCPKGWEDVIPMTVEEICSGKIKIFFEDMLEMKLYMSAIRPTTIYWLDEVSHLLRIFSLAQISQ